MAVRPPSRIRNKAPLTRQQSRASIHSWWSDSNPRLQGATINLHTVTKPLIKFMYHRQALGFIQRNGDTPLSSEILEIYSTYLLYKYVSPITQADILRYLVGRAESEDDACAIVNSPILVQIPQLLDSGSNWVRANACVLVGNLARHESSLAAILAAKPYSDVIQRATFPLGSFAKRPDGAQAVIDANTLPHLSELLESASKGIRKNACVLVVNLARHESTLAAIFAANPFERLVSLLRALSWIRDADTGVIQRATHALVNLAYRLNGAQAVMSANTLPHLSDLLESPSKRVGNLTRHGATSPGVLDLKLCMRLVSLLRQVCRIYSPNQAHFEASDKDAEVMEAAIYALSQASRWLDSAQATVLVDAMGVYHIPKLLKSASPEVLQRTCRLVGNLASYESTVLAVLASKPCSPLVQLLSDTNIKTRAEAASALARISEHRDGVAALVDTVGVQTLEEISRSLDDEIHKGRRTILKDLSHHEQGSSTQNIAWKIGARKLGRRRDRASVKLHALPLSFCSAGSPWTYYSTNDPAARSARIVSCTPRGVNIESRGKTRIARTRIAPAKMKMRLPFPARVSCPPRHATHQRVSTHTADKRPRASPRSRYHPEDRVQTIAPHHGRVRAASSARAYTRVGATQYDAPYNAVAMPKRRYARTHLKTLCPKHPGVKKRHPIQ
ncbi:armadillo-type protein [Mycena galericulata]|nr:armadillo-type protein [Mycena galericulata]